MNMSSNPKSKFPKGSNVEDLYRIYVDQLREGKVEDINRNFSPEILECLEKELKFEKNIEVTGEAYVAEDELILHLNLQTEATLPCAICNNLFVLPISVEDLYFAQPIDEIKSHIFDMRDWVRENILLEVPQFAECSEGHCPERKDIDKYLKKPEDSNSGISEGFKPFKDL
jgi:uncharacterized metal-binding protein YceD (DUF177 family)